MPRVRKYQTNGERQAAYRRRCAQVTDVEVSSPIPSVLGRRRWKAMVKAASVLLDCAATEMQEDFEGHSETWQDSQAGESLAEMLESVQDALASLEGVQPRNHQGKPAIT